MANGAPMQAAMLLRCGLCQLVCFPTSSHCVNHAVWHAACTDVLQRARCSTCADLPISLCPPPPRAGDTLANALVFPAALPASVSGSTSPPMAADYPDTSWKGWVGGGPDVVSVA